MTIGSLGSWPPLYITGLGPNSGLLYTPMHLTCKLGLHALSSCCTSDRWRGEGVRGCLLPLSSMVIGKGVLIPNACNACAFDADMLLCVPSV